MHRPNLIVFSDDWGRHPSSSQHLVSHLLDDYTVTWVNTIGTRPVRADWQTLRRAWEKVREWGTPRRPGAEASRPSVISPRMWPGFNTGWARRLNATLLARAVEHHLGTVSRGDTVLTTLPIVADLVGRWAGVRWVYYCVDDLSAWPGLAGITLRVMEESLIRNADLIVAAGENLAERIRAQGRAAQVLTHGVELEDWQVAADLPPLEILREFDPPLILFWGLVDARVDASWLTELSYGLPQGTIVIAGPQQYPERQLANIPRVRLTGAIPYRDLPRAAAAAAVLIMPYRDLPVTRAMQPLKLKEYLATSKPVVGRRLPGTQDWEDCFFAVEDSGAFVSAVQRCLVEGMPESHRMARARLNGEGWAAKASLLKQLFERKVA